MPRMLISSLVLLVAHLAMISPAAAQTGATLSPNLRNFMVNKDIGRSAGRST